MLRVKTGNKSYIVKTNEIGIQEIAVKGYQPIVTQHQLVQHIYVLITRLTEHE